MPGEEEGQMEIHHAQVRVCCAEYPKQLHPSLTWYFICTHFKVTNLPAHPCRTRCPSRTSCHPLAAMATTLWQPSPLLPLALERR